MFKSKDNNLRVYTHKLKLSQNKDMSLQIAYIKGDGKRIQRNQNARKLEALCSTHFYGPLAVVYKENKFPYKLSNFTPEDLERIWIRYV